MIEVTDEMREKAWAELPVAVQEAGEVDLDDMAEVVAAVLALVERDYPATEYTVSALPEGDISARHFRIVVAYRGRGLWAVLHNGWCLNAAGRWEYEHIPSERTDEWLAGHRFPLTDALAMARAALPRLVVNGVSTEQALATAARRNAEVS